MKEKNNVGLIIWVIGMLFTLGIFIAGDKASASPPSVGEQIAILGLFSLFWPLILGIFIGLKIK